MSYFNPFNKPENKEGVTMASGIPKAKLLSCKPSPAAAWESDFSQVAPRATFKPTEVGSVIKLKNHPKLVSTK